MKFSHCASQNFLGINVEAVTYDEMLSRVDEWLADKRSRSHHIACVNAYCATLALKEPCLARIYNSADLTGADGMPFVYWIRQFCRQECDRIYAPDVITQLAQHARKTGYTFYLYGGAPDVVVEMKAYLERHFPWIQVVGYRSPPFRQLTSTEVEEIRSEINALQPDIICVGLGTPKQDYWIDDNIEAIRGSVMVTCGAAFDFFGGRVKMAPLWIQRSGFEWLYRLLSKDFSRLWRRYTIDNGRFIFNFLLQLLGIRVRKPNTISRDLTVARDTALLQKS